MNAAQTAGIIARLVATYPNYRPADDRLAAQVWMEIVGDLSPEVVKAALAQYSAESHDFAPAPGTIRQYAIHLQAKAAGIPSAAAALDEVMNMPARMERTVVTDQKTDQGATIIEHHALKFSHPFVEKIARMMGWPKQFPSDNPTADRAQFIKIYDSELKDALQDEFAPPVVRAYLDAPQSIKNSLKQLTERIR